MARPLELAVGKGWRAGMRMSAGAVGSAMSHAARGGDTAPGVIQGAGAVGTPFKSAVVYLVELNCDGGAMMLVGSGGFNLTAVAISSPTAQGAGAGASRMRCTPLRTAAFEMGGSLEHEVTYFFSICRIWCLKM